jgi:hypothetical protein
MAGCKSAFEHAPPTITCPDDITACNDPGTCSATTVRFVVAATDDCGLTRLDCTRSDGLGLGDPYPVGTTTVTCTAEDDAGNKSSCSFNVTVKACSNKCPLTIGYSKSHPALWPVTTLTLGSTILESTLSFVTPLVFALDAVGTKGKNRTASNEETLLETAESSALCASVLREMDGYSRRSSECCGGSVSLLARVRRASAHASKPHRRKLAHDRRRVGPGLL